ncbi:hypothetical protein PPTG_03620 [Phytophthora nicotianae INRA-310]|uniref:Uncharacterized protein n=3 Tax=Phytophthora nicotianae TaxID=4792 RepID=W2R5I5_PHYN3|nr:hypothetical protein PPTG_03620 [Phytophthora nicotianae INRA-310]ETI49469.1 hypothetical protein F443_06682 [Phytophthora nicotianae P1569]ETN20662.1 hypothetical protein PPTG_03620 [Phytophthora nicotianae INRA-310]KUF88915.1 hypothetical protein AM587_10011383 [Phytophthora nicotianae]KUF89242.1 hypothetical protein AM588_10002159 [Phytophthora nicotianae]
MDQDNDNYFGGAFSHELPSALPSPTLPPPGYESSTASHTRKTTVCKQLLQSRLQAINSIEEKLEKISKYSLKLMNERDELALMMAYEKEQAIRLAAAAGVPTHGRGYVMSFSVALEQCCEALLEHN